MKYALVLFTYPSSTDHEVLTAWRDLTGVDQSLKTGMVKVQRLNEGAYLFDLSSGLTSLAKLVSSVEARGHQSQTLFFDQAPPFVISKGKNA